jgi:hypothetical protein
MPKFGISRAPGLSYIEPFVEQSDTIKDGAAERHASSRSNLPYGTPDSLVFLEEVTIEDNRPVSTSKRPMLLEEHLSLCLELRRQNHPCDCHYAIVIKGVHHAFEPTGVQANIVICVDDDMT